MYFQLFRDRKKELSIKIDPKSISKTTDLVNNFPEQMSSLAILPLLRLKKGGVLVTVHNIFISQTDSA